MGISDASSKIGSRPGVESLPTAGSLFLYYTNRWENLVLSRLGSSFQEQILGFFRLTVGSARGEVLVTVLA